MKRRREAFLDTYTSTHYSRLFSASTYALWRTMQPQLQAHCRGRVLDAGSGRGEWKSTILATAQQYDAIDVAPRGQIPTTWVGDVSRMPQVPTGTYDTVVCQQVLEHLTDPEAALREFHRVLKPGGKLILSVPHLSRRHELPHDYFRFTQEGLNLILNRANFQVVTVASYGGLLSFLHHQVSFFLPGMLLGIPVLGWLAFHLGALVSRMLPWLDDRLDAAHLMPLGVFAVASTPSGPDSTGSRSS